MRVGRLAWLVAAMVACATACHAQDVALSFDDGFDPRVQPEAAAWNAAILDALAYAEVRAILFPAGGRVDSREGMALVRAWADAGHAIGNHSYAHRSLAAPTTTVDAFVADLVREEALLGSLPGWTRRLRFPYLKEGETAAKRDGVRDWLAAHGYRSGAVTIDTSDWYYDVRWRAWRAAHPTADPAPFRHAYLAHLARNAAYYDDLSKRLFGRSVKHVLLLHANALNAAFLPDVIEMFRANGWTIVRPGDAFGDPVYALRSSALPAGESLLWSLSKAAGATDLRYPAEDEVYEKPLLDALGL
jgi:peptidoglycan/xylan/chitin deacetylase (PgdA/CDA1 family)